MTAITFETYNSGEALLEFSRLRDENQRLQDLVENQREALEDIQNDYNAAMEGLEVQCAMAIQSGEMKTATAFAMKEIRMSQLRARLFKITEALTATADKEFKE